VQHRLAGQPVHLCFQRILTQSRTAAGKPAYAGGESEQSRYLQNCFQTEDMRQGTTSVVPKKAYSNFPALAAAELQATEKIRG
jgi:hypothetical protein